jgi:transcriptional regulator with GAF, ATPase, and Fis domain
MDRKDLNGQGVCNPPPWQPLDHQSQSCISETRKTKQYFEELAESTSFSASRLPGTFGTTNNRFGAVEIIGQSPQTQAMLDFIYSAATNDFPVLLEGESGTGKEWNLNRRA